MNKIAKRFSSFFAGAILFSGCAAIGQPTTSSVVPTVDKSNIVAYQNTHEHNYVYSSKNIEYVDVDSIEKLKEATVLLIDKVNKFEKVLASNNKERGTLKQSLQTTNKKLLEQNNKLMAVIDTLKKTIAMNQSKINELNTERGTKGAAIIKKEAKPSVYDKKILDFLNKEK